MSQKGKDRERSFFYKQKILSVLKAGPSSSMDIHKALDDDGISIASVSQFLRSMLFTGEVCRHSWKRHTNGDLYTIWEITKRKSNQFIDNTLKITKGVDSDDIEWMKYWRLPRDRRRQIAMENNHART